MDRDEAMNLPGGGPEGIAEWNRRRDAGEECPDLIGADLSGANLGRANMSVADLGQANFSHADLSDADLSGAHC